MMAMDQGQVIDWITILTQRFEEYVKKGSRNSALGGGSLITLIAINCNFTFDFPECPKPSKKVLDLDTMRRSRFLKPGTMSWDHDDQPHTALFQERAKKSKDNFKIKNHLYCLTKLTPSPPSSPIGGVPPVAPEPEIPASESIPPPRADRTAHIDQLSADVAELKVGLGRLEEFAHRESQFHRQEAQWVRSTLTSIFQAVAAPSSSAPSTCPGRYVPRFSTPLPFHAPPPFLSTRFDAAEDQFASPPGDDDDDDAI